MTSSGPIDPYNMTAEELATIREEAVARLLQVYADLPVKQHGRVPVALRLALGDVAHFTNLVQAKSET